MSPEAVRSPFRLVCKNQRTLADPKSRCLRANLPFRQHAYPAGPTTTTPCARGPRPRGGLKVILRIPSLTALTEDAATALELESANFGPGSSNVTGCFEDELLRERGKLCRVRSVLIVL